MTLKQAKRLSQLWILGGLAVLIIDLIMRLTGTPLYGLFTAIWGLCMWRAGQWDGWVDGYHEAAKRR